MADELTVVMADDAMATVEQHCFSRVDVEVGGFLIGQVDADGSVLVSAAKPALTASSEQAHLTFTHEAWAEILDVMDTEFPGRSIVGWYHSHPGFGCFLSDYDVFIQENFFGAPGQHALVVDPIAGTWGRFLATDGTAREIGSGTTTRAAAAAAVDKVDVVAASGRTRGRVWPAAVAGIVAASVVVGAMAWFIGNVQGRDEATSAANARVADAQAQAEELQAQLDDALATLAPQPSPDPTEQPSPGAQPTPSAEATPSAQPTPSTETTPPQDPGPVLLAVGEEGVFALQYVVRPGDNLWDLSRKYLGQGTAYRRLLKANPDVRDSGLEPGRTIKILVNGILEGPGQE